MSNFEFVWVRIKVVFGFWIRVLFELGLDFCLGFGLLFCLS